MPKEFISGGRRGVPLTILLFVCLFVLYLPSLRPFTKYAPGQLALAAAAAVPLCIAASYLLLTSPRLRALRRFLADWRVGLGLLLLLLVAIHVVFPIADGLKAQMRGSDADECVIMGGLSLLDGAHPYLERTYFNNPCSPGPGMLVLYLPFVGAGLYPYGAWVMIVLTAWAAGGRGAGALFCAALLSSLIVWDLAVTGSDLIMLGCGIALLALLLGGAVDARRTGRVAALALLAGPVASTRVNFLVLVPLLGFFVAARTLRLALVFVLVAGIVAVVPGFLIHQADPANFTPFHLVGKAGSLLDTPYRELAALASVAAALAGFVSLRRNWDLLPVWVFLSLLPGMAAISLADLIVKRSGDILLRLGQWEGASYLMPLLPLATVIAVSLRRRDGHARA